MQPPVLKTIVEEHDVGPMFSKRRLRSAHPIGVGDHDRGRATRQHDRLVPPLAGRATRARAVGNEDRASMSTSVAAADHGWPRACVEKPARQEGDERRLALTAERQVSHADDGSRRAANRPPAVFV